MRIVWNIGFIGLLAFGIALSDAISRHAESFSDLSSLGKACTVILTAAVLFLVLLFFYRLIKKKK